MPTQRSVPKYQGLQILRAFACTIVLVHHAMRFVSLDVASNFPVWYGGVAGVDLFFILSGFVMVYSSQRLIGKREGWRLFALRRLVRIVPMYWLATGVMLLAIMRMRTVLPMPRHPAFWVIGSFLFLPVRGLSGEVFPVLAVGWTLVFEMLFYFLFASALLLRCNAYMFVGAALCVLSAGVFLRQPHWPAAAFYLDPMVLEFYAGMVVAWLCLNGRRMPSWLAWILGAAALADLLWFPFFSAPWRALELGLPGFVLVYAMASLERHFTRTPAFLLFLAEASYVLYLVHVPVIQGVTKVLPRLHVREGWLAFAACVLASTSVAAALHKWVERPLLSLLRNHFDPSRPASPSIPIKAGALTL